MRIRLRFTKLGKVRFTSHRDVARIWERAFRRAGVAVAYSEGFSPRPRLSFGLALSTGHESLGEYLDADLGPHSGLADLDLAALPERLSPCLPVGMDVVAVAPVAPGTPSLQADVRSCTWAIELDEVTIDEADAAVARTLTAPTLVAAAHRKGQEVRADLRPGIAELQVAPADGGSVALTARLATQPVGVRPGDLVAAILPAARERRVVRTHQWIDDGARREPLQAPGATSPHPEPVCA